MSHSLKMLIGCGLPWLLIFLLPLVGISGGTSLLIAIIVMFAAHLLMVGGGHGGHHAGHTHEDETGEHHVQT